ncbi:MAG: MBL fold metallo-hydrolase [Pseudomonadota bacterium]|nr:MBL fold metallo-hydrolase [Pseudomonadota bacterium]
MNRISPVIRESVFAVLLVAWQGPVHGVQTARVSGDAVVAEARENLRTIDTAQLQKRLEGTPDLLLVDLRTRYEINVLGGSIKARRTAHIPRGWLELRIDEAAPQRDTPIVLYCGPNQRGVLAAATLKKMGYTDVSFYPGGFPHWKAAGLPVSIPDKAPDSMLYSKPVEVIDGVWSAIGATAPGTYENSGHNNNLSFVITDAGVLVVNAGDNYLLARALHDEIRKLTDQPVKYVVLENGQGHAALGSSYWKEQGATVIAHAEAAHEIEENADFLLERMRSRNRDKALGTEVVSPDETFEGKRVIELGGETIELLDLGPAHSPGDIVVWLPQRRLVISGDMAFHERMLPVFDHTDTAAWLETWEKFADLDAKVVIPGHGSPTTMDEVTRYTRDYLVYLRARVAEVIEAGGDLQQAYEVDQSPYADLDTYEFLARKNAEQVFRAMEFE